MSFSRAKLQRFNDAQSCAPAPGAYDPKFDSKVKGAVIEKKERFVKPKSTVDLSESSSSSSGSDRSVPNCLPLLRTGLSRSDTGWKAGQPALSEAEVEEPVPQRRAAVKEVSRNKAAACEGSAKEGHSKQLGAAVDHNVTIKHLETQVQTLIGRISELEHEIRTLQECRLNLEEEYKAQLNDLVQKHSDALVNLKSQSSKCVELQEQLSLSESQLKQLQKLYSDLVFNYSSQKEQCERHLQESNELQSRVAFLESERECNGKCEEDLKNTNAALLSELQELSRASSIVHQLEDKIHSLETEKRDVEKKLTTKQNMIISLQSELSTATLELEEIRLETERLTSECVLERQEHERKVQQYKIMLCDLEKKSIQEQEQYCASSASSEAEISSLKLEVQQLAGKYEEERNSLQHKHDEYVKSLLQQNESIIESKDNIIKVIKEEIELSRTKLADQQWELENLKKAHDIEVDLIRDEHEVDLNKVLKENVLIIETKENLIKSLQENVVMLETKLTDQEHKLCSVKLAYETEISRIQKLHGEEVNKLLLEHANILASKEDLILSLQQGKADVETELIGKECELDSVLRRYETIAKCVREVNMDDVNKILQENALVIECKERVIEAQRKTITVVEAELECKQCELDNLKAWSDSILECTQAAHEEELQKVVFDNATIIESKDAALQALQVNLKEVEAKLLSKERELDDFKISQVENRLTIIELQDAIDTMTLDFGASKAELAAMVEKLQSKETECRKLEVSRRNTHESVEALKVRLLETEDHVQRLTTDNSMLLEEKGRLVQVIRDLEEKLEREKLNIDCMEKEMKVQVECVKSSLLAKLEEFRMFAEEREHELYEVNQKKEEVVNSLSGDLENLRAKLEMMNEQVVDLKRQNNEHAGELVFKESKISELYKNLSAQEMMLASATERNEELAKILKAKGLLKAEMSARTLKTAEDSEGQSCAEQLAAPSLGEKTALDAELVELKETLGRYVEELEIARTWETRARELEALVGPFREQLEAFVAERSALQQSQRSTQQELRHLARQYADILGHQNHQQKIKHLVQLKEQNLALKQDKEKLELRLKQQKRAMDKLKEELAVAQRKRPATSQSSAPGKENHPGNSPLRELPNRHL